MSATVDIMERPEGSRPDTGWLITALGIAQICSWGSLYYSFPLIAEAMGADLGWSKPELYGAATIGLALSGLAAYPVGVAIDRGHGRLIMSLASVTAGLLLIAWSQISNIVLFYLIFAGIGCLQAATLYEPAFAVITRRVGAANARRGITALTLWGGFASTVFIPLIQFLLDGYGWRGALVGLGVINIGICGGLYFAAIDPNRDLPLPVRKEDEAPPLQGRKAVAWVLRRPVFWALVVAFVAYSATFSAFTFHLYPLLLERGLDTKSVVMAMTVIGPAQVAGRMAVWFLAPLAPVRALGSIVVAVFVLAILGVAFLPLTLAVAALIAGIYGAANGIMTIVRGMAVPEMLSRDAYGAINGALTAPTLAVKAFAPVGAAAIWAATGSYDAVLLALVAGALVMAAGFWTAAWMSRRG